MPKRDRLIMKLFGTGKLASLLSVCFLFVWAGTAAAGVPVISGVTVTDVTPRSFSVAWDSSEPATGQLLLFRSDCTTPIPYPVLAAEASDRTGVVRVTASELDSDTAYCFRTETVSRSTAETTVYPVAPVSVTTEKRVTRDMLSNGKVIPFANDLLKAPTPWTAAQGDTKTGILMVMQLLDNQANRPASLILTDDDTKNMFNMNNLFAPGGDSLNLTGSERVKITERQGLLGCTMDRFRKVPSDFETTKGGEFIRGMTATDIDCNDSVNILDVIRVARGLGSSQAAGCFNTDIDQNGDGIVNQLDLDTVIGGFNAIP